MSTLLPAMRIFARRFGATAIVITLLLELEARRVLSDAGNEIAGAWEALLIAKGVTSIAAVATLCVVLVVVAFASQLPLLRRRSGRIAWAISAALIVTALAIELSTGRKAKVLSVRVPFVAGVALLSASLTYALGPRLYELGRRHRFTVPIAGVVLLCGALALDVGVLPRLYLPFHLALTVIAIVGAVMIAEVADLVTRFELKKITAADALAVVGLVLATRSTTRTSWAGKGLATYDNARRIVDERSPILGRAAMLAARKWPPRPLLVGDEGVDPLAQTEERALRANGRDVLLVTIDALRADHVGAYGYARPTTPNLDRLAREGTLFEHAYTPTPHTSYAVSSLMTGKYLRPILTLEAAAASTRRPDETWAGLLRGYGFRTAAFYPPAIFFVDAERFSDLQKRGLDFEYSKIEFAAPDLRAAQLDGYLKTAPKDRPLFAWVHLFEPHEPYVAHPKHSFGEGEIDRYDSEIAEADAGLGAMVARFRAARPGAIVIVTADHGEAFGEHGARYHGTTVYEEQVRVPLVISAPGLVAVRRVDRPVQLVDLLPTVLSAYGVPRPPRVRGRDLGSMLAFASPKDGEGIAFSEVDDAVMLARGHDRLVCGRRTAACALYDVSTDPQELHAIAPGPAVEAKTSELRRALSGLLAASARLEGFSEPTGPNAWPEALRRAFAGDGEAAIDVAPLLDDVDVSYRRKAAEALARLARPETATHVTHHLARATDPQTLAWLRIARARTDRSNVQAGTVGALSVLVGGKDRELARFASLAIGEVLASGRVIEVSKETNGRAFEVLIAWLPDARSDAEIARAVMSSLVALRPPGLEKKATPALLDALDDVRLRVSAADAIGLLGDPGALAGLVKRLANERHLDARAPEALAIARVGGRPRAMPEFARILGVPEAAPSGGALLLDALGNEAPPGWVARVNPASGTAKLALTIPRVPGSDTHRLIVIGPLRGGQVEAKIGSEKFEGEVSDAGGVIELGDALRKIVGDRITLEVTAVSPMTGVALVARVPDLPPPKPDRALDDPEGEHEKAP